MTKSSNDGVGEQLTELFVLCSAIYFKLSFWDAQKQGHDNSNCLKSTLHATDCDTEFSISR